MYSTPYNTSIIIPTYNKLKRLRLTLASLASQTVLEGVEIVLVDNGSEISLRDTLSFFKDRLAIKYLVCLECGRAAARNFGAEHSSGTLLIFLDDDILVEPRFIESHQKIQAETPCYLHGLVRELIGLTRVEDPAEGGVGVPKLNEVIIMKQGFSPRDCRYIVTQLEKAAEIFTQATPPFFAPWLAGAGANFSIDKGVWAEMAGFDRGFGPYWGCEDLEFAFRLAKKQYLIRSSIEPVGYHQSHAALNRWNDHDINLKYFFKKHPCREVGQLMSLLGKGGSIDEYINKVKFNIELNHDLAS